MLPNHNNVLKYIMGNSLYRNVYFVTAKYLSLDDDVHGIPHTLRVLKIALDIACRVKARVDTDILVVATLLHDIGRSIENMENIHHALLSARIAEQELKKLKLDEWKITRIVEAIKAHSFSLNYPAKTIEAKILSDADKIDAIGAIGIARAFIESARRGRNISGTITHFHEKLVNLINLLYLEESKEIALERHNFMVQFFEKLSKEMSY